MSIKEYMKFLQKCDICSDHKYDILLNSQHIPIETVTSILRDVDKYNYEVKLEFTKKLNRLCNGNEEV